MKKEIIKKAFEYLRSNGEAHTQQDVANKMGISKTNISRAFNGDEKYLTKSFLERFNDSYNNVFNYNWLITGEGEMLKQIEDNAKHGALTIKTRGSDVYLETSSGIKYFELSSSKYRMRVPLVPFNAYARYISETCEPIQQERDSWDEVEFIVDKIGHGNYMAFEIKGDGMDDDSKRSFSHGDLVLARELDKVHWTTSLHYNQYPFWIIVLNDTILCKEIIDHNIETGDITCHSLNPSPEYSNFTINLKDVCRIFNIVQKTSTAF